MNDLFIIFGVAALALLTGLGAMWNILTGAGEWEGDSQYWGLGEDDEH